MIRLCSLALTLSLLLAAPGFSQDINRAQLLQLTKIEPAHASYFLPPRGQSATTSPQTSAPQTSSGTSHKKRNIIIAVVAGAVVAGVIVAASNSSGSGY
jgi:hypothetical protein